MKKYLEQMIDEIIKEIIESNHTEERLEQPDSGPPAFGLPPSSKSGPKNMWGRKQKKLSNESIFERGHFDKYRKFATKQEIPANSSHYILKCMNCEKIMRQCRYGGNKQTYYDVCDNCKNLSEMGMPSNGLGHVKKLWHFTIPKNKKIKSEYFVVGGPRNYGAPIGQGTGPSAFENKKYSATYKKIGNNHVAMIKENDIPVHIVSSDEREFTIDEVKNWIKNQYNIGK